MTRVIVSGASGRMGSIVCAAVDQQPDLDLVGRFDPTGAIGVTADPAGLPDADVVVEFTNPDVVMANLGHWLTRGWHAVVGTSGFTHDRVAKVKSMFGAGPPNCLLVPNFSIGAVLAMRFAAAAAQHFRAAEIVEMHHQDKADAPSGTAIATAGRIAAARLQASDIESTELLAGARGASVDGVPIHSLRLPGLVAHQEVILGGSGETLTIRHDTTDREAFLPGVLLAVRRIDELPGVTVGLDTLL